MKVKLHIIALLISAPLWLIGQSPSTIHYTVKDGLPSSTIYTTVQDTLGFMWIGTEAGLVRFDGSHFKVYTTLDGLPDNEVMGLTYDNITDRLWIVTYSKAACYYRKGTIYTGRNDSSLRAITCDIGEFINCNLQPGVGVALYNGQLIYKCANNTITKIKTKTVGLVCLKMWEDSSIDMLISVSGVLKHTSRSETYYPILHGDSIFGNGKWIDHTFYLYKEGRVSLYDKMPDGNYKYRGEIKTDSMKFASNLIIVKNDYYISVPGVGVYKTDTSLRGPVSRIWSGRANNISVDKQGNLWVSTSDDGLYIIRSADVFNYSNDNGLKHDNITALYARGGASLYFGNTYGELFSLKDGQITAIKTNYSIKQEKVRAITTYANSIFFITNNIIAYFNTEDGKNTVINHRGGGPKALLKLKDNNTILVGLLASIIDFKIGSGTHREISTNKRVIAMAQHPDGRIFCGSLDGVYQYSMDTLRKLDNVDPRMSGRVTSLCISQDGLLWIGTPSDGVLAYDGKKVVGHISSTRHLGYYGAICRKVVAGRPNEIWVATNYGVNKIRYHLNDTLIIDNVTPLNMTDGLLSDDLNDIVVNASVVSVATSHGLTILNDRQMAGPPPVPIYISSVRINDKDSAIHDEEYNLSYTQNNLKIEYIGVLLPSASYLRYEYRLLGTGSDKWEVTANTSIEFRSLSAGTYIFEAVVLDKFGNRSNSVARVRFCITPAYYRTYWFWGLVFFAVLALGFYLIRARFIWRQEQYEKEQTLNNKIIELEQQALKAQMNPHFIFNCLTAIQHFVNSEDLYSANMYLSNFAKLIRKTLDLSGEQYVSLDKEIAFLENYIQLEKMRFQEKFEYEVTIDKDVDQYAMQVPPMLLQPIIENAIRHGLRNKDTDTGLLKVDFALSGNKIICMIDDNGVGMKRSMELKTTSHVEYQSKGMKLTLARINAINMISEKKITMDIKDKYDSNNVAAGTLVILSFEQ